MSGTGFTPKPNPTSVPIVRLSTVPSTTNQTSSNPQQQNLMFIRSTDGSSIKIINKTVQSKPKINSPIISNQRPTTSATASTIPQRNPLPQNKGTVLREMQVRVPNRKDRKFSVLRFHESDKVEFSQNKSTNPIEIFMQRENNLKQFKNANNIPDAPTKGAGSEYGKEARFESKMKKYGINKKQYNPEDQPWLMTVGKGKTAKRFRGTREGNVSDNVDYYLFCQTKDGNFDAYPIQDWYKMNPEVSYRFLKEDEAEAEYSKLNKTMNLFNVMVQKKLAAEADDKEDAKKANSSGTGDNGSKASKKRAFKLTDLDDIENDDDNDEDADDEKDEEEKAKKEEQKSKNEKKINKKKKLKLACKRNGTKRRRRKRHADPFDSSEDDDMDYMEEAMDESDPDDHMGDEVDYMTNSSSDEEKLSDEEREKLYEVTGVDEEAGLKALLTDLSEDEDDEEETKGEDKSEKGDDDLVSDTENEDGTKASGSRKRKGVKNASSDESSDKGSSTSESSSEASDSSDSDPDNEKPKKAGDAGSAKKLKTEMIKANIASAVEIQAAANNPSSSGSSAKVDPELMETVAKYLKRKPITLTELMKKIKMKKLISKNENYNVMLAEVLKQLKPIKDMINGQNVLYLK